MYLRKAVTADLEYMKAGGIEAAVFDGAAWRAKRAERG